MKLERSWLHAFNGLDLESKGALVNAIKLLYALPLCECDSVSSCSSPSQFKGRLIAMVDELDQLVSRQLTEILQHQAFQSLEASWNGLRNLVTVPYQKSRIKIKCLDMNWDELSADLNLTSTIDRTQLYNKMANKELNTLGGEPFGVIIVDHTIVMAADDSGAFDELFTLELLGSLGQQTLCPFILSVGDEFFGNSGAEWISDIHRVGKVLDSNDFTGWRRLQGLDSSRFIGLTLPRLQLRRPYRSHKARFIFNEAIDRHVALWGGAHFAFAAIVIREFDRISWFGFMKSRWQDRLQGAVINMPDDGRISGHDWVKPVPDIRLFGKIADFYARRGFIPLTHSSLTQKYYFLDNHSIWKARQTEENADNVILAQIQMTLIGCRVAHFLKVQIREMIGSILTASECESHLSNWLEKLTSNVTSNDDEELARYPLRNASVRVRERDGDSGVYACDVELQPQYQFDMFGGKILLSTELGEGS